MKKERAVMEKIGSTAQQQPQKHKLHAAFSHWFFGALAGVSALGLLRVLAPMLGFTIKINAATLLLAIVFGAPGVVLILILRFLFYVL